nr:integrase, catalytic region, zinc finger, CCHC-type, peptidase aspartic, catalytic [Tanacetum cinerariifolium]
MSGVVGVEGLQGSGVMEVVGKQERDKQVYYVEGLGHNLFSVGQFCDSDLEVAFRKHSYYVRDTDGVEFIKGSRGDRSRLRNFIKKFTGTVRFRNDHFGAIMGYGYYVIGDSMISRVYYVEGRGHNLFYVWQFCNSYLEVAFKKHSCYVRDTDGVKFIKGSRGFNLYTISVKEMLKSSLICLLSKAFKNKSRLWHHCLNHLNFSTINDLSKKDLVRGLSRLKFEKDHLRSACQL